MLGLPSLPQPREPPLSYPSRLPSCSASGERTEPAEPMWTKGFCNSFVFFPHTLELRHNVATIPCDECRIRNSEESMVYSNNTNM